MATTNDFQAFATGGGANVLTQAQYLALSSLIANGFVSGTAVSKQLNKVWRQSSVISAAVAQMIADSLNINVNDNGDLPTIVGNLKRSVGKLGSPFPLKTTKVAIFGDSLLNVGFQQAAAQTTSGGLVVNSGVATFFTGGGGALTFAYPGNRVKVYNPSDPFLSDYINNVMVDVIAAPNQHTFTFSTVNPATGLPMADGDYSNVYGGPWYVQTQAIMTDQSWFNQLNYLCGGQFEIVANYGFSGQTTLVMAEYITKALQSGPDFDLAIMSIGTGDIVFATSVTQAITFAMNAYAEIETFMALLWGAGKAVLYALPVGVSNSVGGQPHVQQSNLGLNALRDAMINLKNDRGPLLRTIDLWAALGDGRATNGDLITGATTDGLHPSSQGALAIAKSVLPTVQEWLPQKSLRFNPFSVLEDSATYAQPGALYANLLTNGLMAGTGGTVIAPATGTAPNGWLVQWSGTAGTSLAVAGQAAHPLIDSQPNSVNWGYALTLNAVFDAAVRTIVAASPDFSAQMFAGNWYRFGIRLVATAASVNLQSVQANFQLLNGVQLEGFALNSPSPGTNNYPLASGDVLTFVAPPFFYAAGLPALTNAFCLLTITSNGVGVGSAQLAFCEAFVRLMDPPY